MLKPRRIAFAAAACVGCAMLAAPAVAQADELSSTSTGDVLFPWVKAGGFSDNWLEGLGFAGLGVLGALVTVYFLLGNFLPSMGGKAEYEEQRLELIDLTRRQEKQLEIREQFSRGEAPNVTSEQLAAADKLTADLGLAIGQKETELRDQKRSLRALGLPIYVVLGGAFAVLFATNGLQALLIGFGWTALAERIGLGKELDAKMSKREEEVQKTSARPLAAQAMASMSSSSESTVPLARPSPSSNGARGSTRRRPRRFLGRARGRRSARVWARDKRSPARATAPRALPE